MNKKIWIGFTVLVSLNLVLTALLLFKKPPRPMHEQKGQIKLSVIECLGLTNEQKATYESLIKEHQKEMRSLEHELKKTKDALFNTLSSTRSEEPDPLFKSISQIHFEIERLHYDHFLKIRDLCKGDQIKKFDELAQHLGPMLGPQSGKMKHPPFRRNKSER